MHTLRTIAAAVLTVSSLVVVGATADSASAATGSKNLTVQHGAKVIKNEQFDVSGQLTTRYERQVKLQYKSGSSWKTVDTETASSSDGRFLFEDVATSKSRYYRFYAAKSEGNGDESGKAITGTAKKVTVVSQSVKAYITPNSYLSVCGVENRQLYLVADVQPARGGRTVSFTSPNNVAVSGSTDTAGHVVLPFTVFKSTGTYQVTATASAYNGAPVISAAPASVSVTVINIC